MSTPKGKWTPGPLRYEPGIMPGTQLIRDRDGCLIASCDAPYGAIFAAAPSLVEALREIDKGLYSHRLTMRQVQAICRAALKKAEGE